MESPGHGDERRAARVEAVEVDGVGVVADAILGHSGAKPADGRGPCTELKVVSSEPVDLPAPSTGPDLHELVNLVNGVLVQAQLLSRRLDSEIVASKTRESVAAVNAECRRLLEFLRAHRG